MAENTTYNRLRFFSPSSSHAQKNSSLSLPREVHPLIFKILTRDENLGVDAHAKPQPLNAAAQAALDDFELQRRKRTGEAQVDLTSKESALPLILEMLAHPQPNNTFFNDPLPDAQLCSLLNNLLKTLNLDVTSMLKTAEQIKLADHPSIQSAAGLAQIDNNSTPGFARRLGG